MRREFKDFIDALEKFKDPALRENQQPVQQQQNDPFIQIMSQLQQATNSVQNQEQKQALLAVLNPFSQQIQKINAYYQNRNQQQAQPQMQQQQQQPTS